MKTRTEMVTPGERLAEQFAGIPWSELTDKARNIYEVKAVKLGIQPETREVKPPTDGELFEQAMLHTRVDCGKAITHRYEESAAEFLRLLKERDGISNIPCCRCEGDVREFSIDNEVWNRVVRNDGPEHDKEYLCALCYAKSASEEIARLLRERDGEPLPVTGEQVRGWWSATSVNGYARWSDVAARINAHRGVRELPKVTGAILAVTKK